MLTNEQLKTLQKLRDELAWGKTPEGTVCIKDWALDQLISAVIARAITGYDDGGPYGDSAYALACVKRALEQMEWKE
jgi:hypothetical protein